MSNLFKAQEAQDAKPSGQGACIADHSSPLVPIQSLNT